MLPSKPHRPSLVTESSVHQSTWWLVGICVILLVAIGVIGWRAWHYKSSVINVANADEPTIAVGVPDDPSRQQKIFDAASAVLIDAKDGHILFQQNGFEQRPIASISKLMTAMVALDYGIPWDKTANILPDEYGPGTGNLVLGNNETVTMKDLFNASLLGSANNATAAYVRQLGVPTDEFVQAMNRKAISLGLEQTNFVEVTGLDPANVSTAYEVAKMAQYAFSHYPQIAAATDQKEYAFTIMGSGRQHTIRNTNKLISTDGEDAGGSKTGYLYEAQYCLVMVGEGAQAGRIGVILGSPTEDGQFTDMQKLLSLNVPD